MVIRRLILDPDRVRHAIVFGGLRAERFETEVAENGAHPGISK